MVATYRDDLRKRCDRGLNCHFQSVFELVVCVEKTSYKLGVLQPSGDASEHIAFSPGNHTRGLLLNLQYMPLSMTAELEDDELPTTIDLFDMASRRLHTIPHLGCGRNIPQRGVIDTQEPRGMMEV